MATSGNAHVVSTNATEATPTLDKAMIDKTFENLIKSFPPTQDEIARCGAVYVGCRLAGSVVKKTRFRSNMYVPSFLESEPTELSVPNQIMLDARAAVLTRIFDKTQPSYLRSLMDRYRGIVCNFIRYNKAKLSDDAISLIKQTCDIEALVGPIALEKPLDKAADTFFKGRRRLKQFVIPDTCTETTKCLMHQIRDAVEPADDCSRQAYTAQEAAWKNQLAALFVGVNALCRGDKQHDTDIRGFELPFTVGGTIPLETAQDNVVAVIPLLYGTYMVCALEGSVDRGGIGCLAAPNTGGGYLPNWRTMTEDTRQWLAHIAL